MLAVIKTGGKQYLVKKGDVLKLEKLAVEKGASVVFDKVLMTIDEKAAVTVGKPYLAKASVEATCVRNLKTKKIDVLKYKNKVRYRKRFGHRQQQTEVKIDKINA